MVQINTSVQLRQGVRKQDGVTIGPTPPFLLFFNTFLILFSKNTETCFYTLTALACNLLKEYLSVSTPSASSFVTSISNVFKMA